MVKTKEEFEASNNASNIIPMIVSKLHRGVIKLGEKDNKSNNRLRKPNVSLIQVRNGQVLVKTVERISTNEKKVKQGTEER